ncbi:TPA: macrolide transporter subunit MacA [Salmonella enterica]|nr:macrolide transporter subunit MacA [Salmonella enterica]
MRAKGKKFKKRYLVIILILLVGGMAGWRMINAPLPTYQTLIVRPGDLEQSVLATGKLDALRKVDVGAQVSGQLKTLLVSIGDNVKKDQLLGVIDPDQAENQIKEVEATLMELNAERQQAAAELKLARVTLARQQQLAKTQAVSQQDLDTAATEMAVKQARIGTIDAQIKRNRASLDTAKTNLEYTRIVAPMAGEVTQITTLQGQTVIAAQQAPNILTLVAVISLVVGGIGVMNIMLVSVTERTREIGIRMAVGARASDVLQQFLIEAVLVCLVGGALGISLSMFIAFMLQLFLPGWEIGFSLTALASAFLCSTFTGILFGWLPARNAARLDPVDALARE